MKHIYGFINSGADTDFGPVGIGGNGEAVRGLACDGVAAVISEAGSMPLTSLPTEALVKKLAQHQSVIEAVMKAGHTVLPMKFGTVVDTETQVTEMLEANLRQLQTLLSDIEGLFEVEVVAMWPDVKQVFAQIGRQPDVMEMRKAIAGLPQKERTTQTLRLGKLVKDRLDAMKRALQARILPALAKAARRHMRLEVRHDAMVINAAFLLDAKGRDTLEALVGKADREQCGALNFRIVGPLPPYSFCTAQLRRARTAELRAAQRELGLPECITPQAVADAARSAMRRFHPDANPTDADLPEKFERIKAAADLVRQFCPSQGMDLGQSRREFLLVEPMEAP